MAGPTRSRTQTLMLVAGVVIAALPIAFGVFRAATTGTDFRYLGTAVAALAGALAINARGQAGRPTWLLILLAISVSTLLAAATAYLVGARSPGAVLAVALAFGGCAAVGTRLIGWSRVGQDTARPTDPQGAR